MRINLYFILYHQANSFKDKVRICERAYNLVVHQLHFSPCDVIFDPGVLTIGTGMKEHEKFAMDFIQATSVIKRRLKGVRVVGGISNLSFSFRGLDVVRRALHSVFLFHAIKGWSQDTLRVADWLLQLVLISVS